MTDWADKARVELDEFVGDLWVEDDEGGVKLYVGLDGEDAAEYLRANFIPRARVELMIKDMVTTALTSHGLTLESAVIQKLRGMLK